MSIGIPDMAIPSNWQKSRLGDLVSISNRTGLPAENPILPYVGMEHNESETGKLLSYGDPAEYRSSSFVVDSTQVLYGRLRPYLNKVFIPKESCYASREFIPMNMNEDLNKQFLLYLLRSSEFVEFAISLNTGDRPRVKWPQMAGFPISLPPVLEQEKIVEILDEQLSRLDAAMACVIAVRKQAERFRRSLLHAAFSGALTGDDTSFGNVPKGWLSKNVGDIASIKTGKIDVNEAVEDGAYPFFTCAREIHRINEAPYEGRVVIIAGNGDLNVKYYEGKFNAYQRTYLLTVLDEAKVLPRYLFHFMQMYVEHLRKISIGTTIKYIKLGDLRDAAICVPPLAHQEKIVEILEEQLSHLDASLSVADSIERKASALRRSLLHSSFTGDLTKKWREGAHV